MKNEIDWSDLKLFLSVARGHGLSAAARATGISPATLGRAMLRLERWAGVALFVRRTQGYALTAAGHRLFEQAVEAERQMDVIERWRSGRAERAQVRVSAGTWVAQLLVQNMATLWQPEKDPFTLVMLTTNERIDIARRHADIGIRNRRPSEPWLAGRRVAKVTFAPYRAAKDNGAGANDWLALEESSATTPSTRWVIATYRERIGLRTNDPRHCRNGRG